MSRKPFLHFFSYKRNPNSKTEICHLKEKYLINVQTIVCSHPFIFFILSINLHLLLKPNKKEDKKQILHFVLFFHCLNFSFLILFMYYILAIVKKNFFYCYLHFFPLIFSHFIGWCQKHKYLCKKCQTIQTLIILQYFSHSFSRIKVVTLIIRNGC